MTARFTLKDICEVLRFCSTSEAGCVFNDALGILRSVNICDVRFDQLQVLLCLACKLTTLLKAAIWASRDTCLVETFYSCV